MTGRDACAACDGSGWICPSPFHEDEEPPVSWGRHLEAVAARIADGDRPESCASFTGMVRPVPCRRGCPPAWPAAALVRVVCPWCGSELVYVSGGRPERLIHAPGCGGDFVALGAKVLPGVGLASEIGAGAEGGAA